MRRTKEGWCGMFDHFLVVQRRTEVGVCNAWRTGSYPPPLNETVLIIRPNALGEVGQKGSHLVVMARSFVTVVSHPPPDVRTVFSLSHDADVGQAQFLLRQLRAAIGGIGKRQGNMGREKGHETNHWQSQTCHALGVSLGMRLT